jgi:RNase adapter protein RapZ
MRYIILTGTSGAGKITASNFFGDIGYYAVDNLPPRLLPELARSCRDRGCDRVLAVVDARVGTLLSELPAALEALSAQGTPAEVIYLDASDEVLVRRFKETRRPHPIFEEGRGSILDAVRAERALLDETRALADKVIDTSNLSPSELAAALATVTGEQRGPRLNITLESFGFKHGLPIDADLVFDVRFLANPHYVPELKPFTGRDPAVAHYVHQDPLTEPFLEKMMSFVSFALPQYEREGKAYLTIAIGCTGGRHRSVTIAEDVARYLGGDGYRVTVFHRDADRERPAPNIPQDTEPAS